MTSMPPPSQCQTTHRQTYDLMCNWTRMYGRSRPSGGAVLGCIVKTKFVFFTTPQHIAPLGAIATVAASNSGLRNASPTRKPLHHGGR